MCKEIAIDEVDIRLKGGVNTNVPVIGEYDGVYIADKAFIKFDKKKGTLFFPHKIYFIQKLKVLRTV
jgi:hypothetical protein